MKNIEEIQGKHQKVKPAPVFQVISHYCTLEGWIINSSSNLFETDNIELIIHIKDDLYLIHLKSASDFKSFVLVKAETNMDFASITK